MLLLLLGLVVALGCVAAVVLYALAREPMGGTARGPRLERMRASPHWRDGRFVNTQPTTIMKPGALLETWRMYREPAVRNPARPIPVQHVAGDVFARKPPGGFRVTWLGHSAFLVELDGAVILLDPALYSRSSPFSWVGAKRFFPSPLAIRDLPELDAVVVSHDHYDHLAMDEIKALAPKTKRFVVPLGVGANLERWHVPPGKIVELDWWEETTAAGVRIVALPARHYSGRGFGRDRTLWASMALIGPAHQLFFSGDTGPTDELAQVGERLGPFDVAIVKIGAYGRTWPDIHLTPQQALAVFHTVRGRVFMPAHWGTYNLAAHSWYEPAERLVAAARDSGVTAVLPLPGQPVVPDDPPPAVRWWEAAIAGRP